MAIITQKECADVGKGTAHSAREVTADVRQQSAVIGIAGGFNQGGGNGDAYADCAFSSVPWKDFVFRTNDSKTPIPDSVVQVVRKNIGMHGGIGDILIPFSFKYETETIEKEFRRGLSDVIDTMKSGKQLSKKIKFESGQPILMTSYPFESGLSVLAKRNDNLELGQPVRPIAMSLSARAWNGMLKSITSNSNQYDPPVKLPEKIRHEALLTLIIVTFLSVVVCRAVLAKIGDARSEVVRRWPPRTGRTPWAVVRSPKDTKENLRYRHHTKKANLEALVAIISTLIAIVAALLEFDNSDIKPRHFVTVQQRGIITYGQVDPTITADEGNILAGSPFVIGHWCLVQVQPVGSMIVYVMVLLFYASLLLVLLLVVYSFSCQREQRLSATWIRYLLKAIRVPVQLMILLLSKIPLPRGRRFCKGYRDTYKDLIVELCKYYPGTSFPSRQGTLDFDGQIELDYRRMNNPSASHLNITADDIEKAAIVLASDLFGRLTYPQALALIADADLSYAVDLCKWHKHIPLENEIRKLAAIYYTNAIVVPGKEKNRFSEENIQLMDIDNEWNSKDEEEQIKFKIPGWKQVVPVNGQTGTLRVGVVVGADNSFPENGDSGRYNVCYALLWISEDEVI